MHNTGQAAVRKHAPRAMLTLLSARPKVGRYLRLCTDLVRHGGEISTGETMHCSASFLRCALRLSKCVATASAWL